jgi:hypothetical protein
MSYHELGFETLAEALKALEGGQCDVFTSD